MFLITDIGPKINDEEILELEEKYDGKFTNEYKDFLKNFNGGSINPNILNTKTLNIKEHIDEIYIISMCGLRNDFSEYDIYKSIFVLGLISDTVYKNFIPIACDINENRICLGVSGKYYGKLYLLESYGEEYSLIFLANSMEELFSNLIPSKDNMKYNEDLIEEFAEENNLKLPNSYKNFLTIYEYGYIMVKSIKGNHDASLDYFFNDKIKSFTGIIGLIDLYRYIEKYENLFIPKDFVIIADDLEDNYLCIGVSEQYYDNIVLMKKGSNDFIPICETSKEFLFLLLGKYL